MAKARHATRTADAAPAAVQSRPVPTRDSIVNLSARLGLGSDNVSAGSTYAYSLISRNRQNLDNAYRGSWLVGVAVDSVADDMSRGGIEMMGSIKPAAIEAIQESFVDLSLWQGIGNTERWARLYGGCIAVMLIDGQDVSTPLRLETVGKYAFQGLLVMDRWMVSPSLEDVITDFGPDMGQPTFYRVNSTLGMTSGNAATSGLVSDTTMTPGNLSGVNIHYSRVIRLDGNELPFFARQSEQGWGLSVLERLYDRLLAYDSATQGVAQLVYKAHLRTLQVEGLREAIAFGGKALEGLAAQIDFIRKFQTSDGLTLLDAADKFDVHSYQFGGLPDVLKQFSEQLSGALQIPLVRLFGQSPSGFSGGDVDLQNYYDMVKARQEKNLRRPLLRLLQAVSRSTLGKPLPKGFGFKFTSLWEMDAAQKATIAGTITTAVTSAQQAGLLSQKTAMEELRQSSYQTGIFTNITDEDLAAADADINPPGAGEAMGDPNAGDPNNPNGPNPGEAAPAEAPDPALPTVIDSTSTADEGMWQESKFKRSKGQFASKGGATAAAAPNRPAAASGPPAAGGDGGTPATTGAGNRTLEATTVVGGKRVMADGSPLPAHIEVLKLPPAWSNVRVSANPASSLLAQGKDAKGRTQSVYSAEFSAKNAAEKFVRVDALAQAFPAIQAQNAALQRSTAPKVKDAADCLDLIMHTGVRPGGEGDTGAEKQAFGATTLQGQHVVQEGDATYLRFTGKKGVSLNLKVDDPGVATMLKERAETAGADGKLFPNTNAKGLVEHTGKLGDGLFTPKDFRTHLGTATASRLVAQTAAPLDEASYKKRVMDVAKAVSAKLGNTPAIALQSYISPAVFGAWKPAGAAEEKP